MSSNDLTPQTKWEEYSLTDLIELAEEDNIICTTAEDVIQYLRLSTDSYFEQLDANTFKVLFA